MQLIALKTRSAAATNSGGLIFFPLLFLTPNFVPRELLTRPMEIAATLNPVTYVMESLRSLILDDLAWATIWPGFVVVGVAGALMLVAQRADDQPLRLSGGAQADDAAGEAALVHQLERRAWTPSGSARVAAADHDRGEEQVALVDEAGGEAPAAASSGPADR